MTTVSENQTESAAAATPWNDRVLIAAVIVTMLLSMLGYMHG